MASSAKTAESTPVVPKKKVENKKYFEKVRNFSDLDEGDCQTAWLFAYWGQFGCQRRAWPDGADSPHFHVHIVKISQFFKIRVSLQTKQDYV